MDIFSHTGFTVKRIYIKMYSRMSNKAQVNEIIITYRIQHYLC